jgi:phosphomannomutase/phosphoglucomutase
MSGHLFFADRYFGYDDAVYAGCRLIEILVNSDKPLSSHFAHLPKTYATPEIRIDCPDDRKFNIVDECRRYFSGKFKTIDIDGVRILFDRGWGLIRASNTQPALVLRFEANDPNRLSEIEEEVNTFLAWCLNKAKESNGRVQDGGLTR